jgi:hypothetical protein
METLKLNLSNLRCKRSCDDLTFSMMICGDLSNFLVLFILVLLKYGYTCLCTLGSQGIRKLLMHQKRNAETQKLIGNILYTFATLKFTKV